MEKKIVLAILCLTAMLLTQCAKKSVPKASVSPKEELAEMTQKYTPAQIAEGKTVFEHSCAQCHDLHPPQELTIPDWDKILPKMSRKADLTADEAGKVRAYVITNAKG